MKRFVLPMLLAAALPAADSRITTAMTPSPLPPTNNLWRRREPDSLSLQHRHGALHGACGRPRPDRRGNPSRPAPALRLHLRFRPRSAARRPRQGRQHRRQRTAHRERTLGAKGLAIQPAFENTLTNNYQAPPTPLDFIANPEAARSQINRWTEEHTKEKIKNLLPAGSLDAQTRVVLTSAIYFYGKWQDPFVTSHTQPAPFTLPAGATTQANFMNQTSDFGYTATPSAQILEMRYGRHRDGLRRPAADDPHRPFGPREIADTWKPDRLARPPYQSEGAGEPAEVPRRIAVLSPQGALGHGHAYELHQQGRLLGHRPETQRGDLRGGPQGFRRCCGAGDRSRRRDRHHHARHRPCACRNRPLSSAPITRSSS